MLTDHRGDGAGGRRGGGPGDPTGPPSAVTSTGFSTSRCLAGFAGHLDRDLGVPPARGADRDGVDVVAIQQRSEVGLDGNLERRAERARCGGVDVMDAHEFGVVASTQDLGVHPADHAGADDSEPDGPLADR